MSLLLPGVVMVVGTHTGHPTPPGEGATAMPSGLEPLICVRFELGIVCSSRADQRSSYSCSWGGGGELVEGISEFIPGDVEGSSFLRIAQSACEPGWWFCISQTPPV